MAIEDQRLVSEVERAIGLLTNVSQYELRVTADRGRVRIEGVVHHLDAKREAIEAAWKVAGVAAVDDAVAVETPHPPRDAAHSEALDEALEEDEEVAAIRLGADSAQGQAVMVGTAESVRELGRGIDTASEVLNTTNVIDSARIGNPYGPDQTQLANAVADVIRKHPVLHNRQIRPIIEETGKVVLIGQVRNEGEKREALSIVSGVPGLHSIREELEIVP